MRRSGKQLSRSIGLTGCLLITGCDGLKQCPEPFEQRACDCGPTQGSQMCLPERVWGDCECADGGGSDSGTVGGAGGASASAGAGAGGSMAGGSAVAGSGATGGTAGAAPIDAGTDSGTTPLLDGGADAGTAPAGSGGSGGTGGTSGSGPAPDPYRACVEDMDCGANSSCAMDSTLLPLPADVYVCAPSCGDTPDCPVPAGSYEATVACVDGACRLDCSAEFLAPLRTCPSGMSCITEGAGIGPASYCYRD